MRIAPIFTDRLYSFHYSSEIIPEFDRLFENWSDIVYLEDFFERNKVDLLSGFYKGISIEDAIMDTLGQAQLFEEKLLNLSSKKDISLDQEFANLGRFESRGSFTNTKAKSGYTSNWLRLYALKIESGVYVITGGAIKLTRAMQERPHTNKELSKLTQCQDFLRQNGIFDIEGFQEFFI